MNPSELNSADFPVETVTKPCDRQTVGFSNTEMLQEALNTSKNLQGLKFTVVFVWRKQSYGNGGENDEDRNTER